MRRKWWLVLLPALALLIWLYSSGQNKSDNKRQSVEEKPVLTFWTSIDQVTEGNIKSYGETVASREAERRTGVHIEYMHPATESAQEQFDFLIASGNLPDLMWYSTVSAEYTGGMDALIDDGIFLDLTDYLQYMPHYVAAMNRNEETKLRCMTDTGRYALAWMISSENEWCWGGPLIRKDWLEECGLGIPETYDEWHTVLTAFKEKMGASVPLLTSSRSFFGRLDSLNAGYDCDNGFIVKDDKIIYSPVTEEYREFLDRMQQWYQEGLIDTDFVIRDEKDISSVEAGETGIILYGLWTYPEQFELRYGQEWAAAPYPVLEKGEKAHLGLLSETVSEDGVGITTACRNPELAAKWIDFFYSQEGSLLKNYGIEEETFVYVDGEPQLTQKIYDEKKMGVKSFYDYLGVGNVGIYDWTNQLDHSPKKNLDCYEVWENSIDRTHTLPKISLTSQEGATYSAIMEAVDAYVTDRTVYFVTGGNLDDEWDDYARQVEMYGIREAEELMQTAWNRYQKRMEEQ